jgi:hypothetical protein
MIQIWPKVKLWFMVLWLCIIIFWWINAFFSVQKDAEIPLENDILQADIEPEETIEDKEITIDNKTIDEETNEEDVNNDDDNKNTQDDQEIAEEPSQVEQTVEKQAVTILFPPFYDQAMIDAIAELIEEQSW